MALQMSWDEILRGVATSYVNHGLTLLTAYLAQKLAFSPTLFSADNLLVLSGALVTGALSLAMLLYRKKLNHNIITAARSTEPGTPFTDIQDVADTLPIIGDSK